MNKKGFLYTVGLTLLFMALLSLSFALKQGDVVLSDDRLSRIEMDRMSYAFDDAAYSYGEIVTLSYVTENFNLDSIELTFELPHVDFNLYDGLLDSYSSFFTEGMISINSSVVKNLSICPIGLNLSYVTEEIIVLDLEQTKNLSIEIDIGSFGLDSLAWDSMNVGSYDVSLIVSNSTDSMTLEDSIDESLMNSLRISGPDHLVLIDISDDLLINASGNVDIMLNISTTEDMSEGYLCSSGSAITAKNSKDSTRKAHSTSFT